MKYDAKNLKINSIVLMILSVLGVIMFGARFMTGENSIDKIMENSDLSRQTALITLIVFSVLCCLMYLIEFYIGFKGLRQANGKCKGGANITLAKIMLVINILSLAFNIYDLIQGNRNIDSLCQSLIYTSFLYPYIKGAKAV